MAKDKLTEYSATNASNDVIGDISVAEGMLPSAVNNALREQMTHLKNFSDGTDGIDVLSLADDDASAAIKIQAPSAVTTTTTLTLPDGDGDAGAMLQTNGSGQLAWSTAYRNRNLIINGAMNVAQRGTSGINSAAGGGICADRHKGFSNGGGVFSMEQSSTVPNNEFAYSSKLTVTTADSSIASADYYSFQQTIEGYNIIQTGYGTSDAKRLTLSFWVRSSVTGKYSVTCFNNGGTEGYLNTFNISSADTWQKVELSWVGRTSGTWLKTNGAGMIIRFDLGGGSSGHGTADQWTTTSGYGNTRTADSVDWIATNGATFYMTGVQLEIGEQATPFEHRSYNDELLACMRFYQQIGGELSNVLCTGQCTSSTLAQFFIPFIVPMRDDPTCSVSDQTHFRVFNAAVSGIPDTTNMTIAATNAASHGGFRIVATVGSGLVAGNATMLSGSDSDSNAGIIKMDAEL